MQVYITPQGVKHPLPCIVPGHPWASCNTCLLPSDILEGYHTARTRKYQIGI